MEHLTHVESTIRPEIQMQYGKNGIDYNFNIVETERDGDTIYVYETYRFEDKFDFLDWKYENGIHITSN